MKTYTFKDYWHGLRGMSYFSLRYAYEHLGWWNPRAWRWEGLLAEAVYYAKCHFWRKYNTVTAKTLPPTWQDADERILHINFAILQDVIEKEKIFERNSSEGDADDVGRSWAWALKEMRTLSDWWKARPERLAKKDAALTVWHDELVSNGGLASQRTTKERHLSLCHQTLEREGEEEDEAMLIRLIKLRPWLWT